MNTSTPTSATKGTRPYAMTTRAANAASTRDRIAREAAALFLADDYDDVTLAKIAKAAGVSHQTVLNHFESKEGVVGAAAELIGAETGDRRRATPGDLDGAIAALVAEYERIGDANARWAATADRVPVLAPGSPEAASRPPGVARRDVRRLAPRRPGGPPRRDPPAPRRHRRHELEAAPARPRPHPTEVEHLMREQVAAILDHRPTPAREHPRRKNR